VEETLMARILALTSRLPYPPREGHQLRSWHILRALAERHDVTLLSFVRDDDLPDSTGPLRDTVTHLEAFPVPSEGSRAILAAALVRGLFGSHPFVAEKYESATMRARIAELLPQVDIVHVDMLPLAALVEPTRVPLVLNAHNVEHELLQRRIEIETRPLQRAFLRTQVERLKRFETSVCRRASRILACSDNDARQLATLAPGTPIAVVPNGVDTDAIHVSLEAPSRSNRMIFVGQMSWFPNRDGVEWFLAEILPRIVRVRPDARFALVGKNAGLQMPAAVADNVELLGFVDDLAPVMRDAAVYVVPLRAGSGTRLKVLEAMAFGKAIVTTHIGSEGITLEDGESALYADSADDFAAAVLRVMDDRDLAARLGGRAREHAVARYDWKAITAAMMPAYANFQAVQ
jgi:glycosyltransferase involved in cell wall biosynthesis